MGTASSECQEKLRRVVKDLEGVEQIQDDVVVHRKGEAHDRNLEICLHAKCCKITQKETIKPF